MRIWIDLNNSPHVPFFRALVSEFERRGHEVEITARRFAQTVELAHAAGFAPAVIGEHGGRKLLSKAWRLVERVRGLRRWARGKRFDLAVSHNAHEHLVAARTLGIRSVTLMDYEHNPANHLSFRLASRVIVPEVFPEASLRRFGVSPDKVRRYHGIKEDVYLTDFVADPRFDATLREQFGIETGRETLVVVRPPARDALYHRFENELFDELLEQLVTRAGVKVILLARTDAQRAAYSARTPAANIILPRVALDGANLISASDLVISAGGTMNREAAALGVPVVTIYAGRWAAVDELLVREGRLMRINTRGELKDLRIEKKRRTTPRRAPEVRDEVARLILEG
jgi:predicted glycosyltransferase